MKEQGIEAAFHYVPLHSAPAGVIHGTFSGPDRFTTLESERLVRLPMYYQLEGQETVAGKIEDFLSARSS